MRVQEMLRRKAACSDNMDKNGEGLDCHKCRLCDQVKFGTQGLDDAHGEGIEGAEIKLLVNPCLLLDELAAKIKAK